ncbi:MAG TPA: NAD(+) synthase [Vicinamibacterales bacterium]|jgi:NAD+ synthase (glutamine-hydrolysing)
MSALQARPDFGFVRVAAAVPALKVADIEHNVRQILECAARADEEGAELVAFPELCLTGYTAGDLFHQQLLLDRAAEALAEIASASSRLSPVLIVGFPLAAEGCLFNTAAVVSGGTVLGLVPKTYIPGYKEYYEERWFASSRDLLVRDVPVGGQVVPIGTDLLFRAHGATGFVFGVEICEDLWGPLPPSSFQVLHGAQLIVNLSASNELVGKADYRRALVAQQSARGICAYVYASCGAGESSQDVVFGGHAIIAEDGSTLAESARFSRESELLVADVDIEHLRLDRERTTSFSDSVHAFPPMVWRTIDVGEADVAVPNARPARSAAALGLRRPIDPTPFIPLDDAERNRRTEEIISIQTSGLAKRMTQTKIERLVVGLSGGLDSTLALLVAVRAFDLLGLPRASIFAFTMPGFGTSARTRGNAGRLAQGCGVTLEAIDITEGCLQQFRDIGHDRHVQDVTFENVQARYRTMVLMNKANQLRALVLGTGDLSEIALGWNTFNGDHISHYNVNAGVPKTLVRHLVGWVAAQPSFAPVKAVLDDVLQTPISPELVSGDQPGAVFQRTEDIIGPYELHDFFLYHFARWESRPAKILFLATSAFRDRYDADTIRKWLRVFITRFFGNQWKRSVMPDGPKVGSVALSPRGDWRMPSDAEVTLWLDDLSA